MILGMGILTILFEKSRLLIPLVGIERFENFGRERSVYHDANFVQRRCASRRKYLHCHIAQCCSFGRTSKNSSPGGVGGPLVQQAILRSSTNDADLFHAPSTYQFQIPKNDSVFEGQTLKNGAHVGSGRLRARLLIPFAEFV